MLRFVEENLFNSPAQTLVNTVNTVGVMGKGIAKEFKARYPAMYSEYKYYCDKQEIEIGVLHVWRGADQWVLNFPTKTTWRKSSQIDFIERGLHTFVNNYVRLGIRSISFPPLGCGNGDLNWKEVKPLMVQYLSKIDIPVWVHELFYVGDFKPEQRHASARLPPATFDDFVRDIRAVIEDQRASFSHWHTGNPFRAQIAPSGELNVYVDKNLVLDEDFLAMAWVGLRLGFLTPDALGVGPSSPGYYVLPIIRMLPYVRAMSFSGNSASKQSGQIGLLFNQAIEHFDQQSAVRV